MILREVVLRETEISVAKGLSIFKCWGPARTDGAVVWLCMDGREVFGQIMGHLHFGDAVQLQAAISDACTGEAELGSCCFRCAYAVVDGLLC